MTAKATKVAQSAYNFVQNFPTFNFDSYQATVDSDLALSNELYGNVTRTGQAVARQELIASAFATRLDEIERFNAQKNIDHATSGAQFLLNIQNIYTKGKAVEQLLNETMVSASDCNFFQREDKGRKLLL